MQADCCIASHSAAAAGCATLFCVSAAAAIATSINGYAYRDSCSFGAQARCDCHSASGFAARASISAAATQASKSCGPCGIAAISGILQIAGCGY